MRDGLSFQVKNDSTQYAKIVEDRYSIPLKLKIFLDAARVCTQTGVPCEGDGGTRIVLNGARLPLMRFLLVFFSFLFFTFQRTICVQAYRLSHSWTLHVTFSCVN